MKNYDPFEESIQKKMENFEGLPSEDLKAELMGKLPVAGRPRKPWHFRMIIAMALALFTKDGGLVANAVSDPPTHTLRCQV